MSQPIAVHRPPRLDTQSILCTGVLAAVAFTVVYPVALVVLQSFQVAGPGEPAPRRTWPSGRRTSR